jgi:hypothetical protein
MGVLEYVIKTAINAAPQHPGFEDPALYLILNLTVPIGIGIGMTWITRLLEKGLIRLLGEKR